jgi:RNA polymerase sigma-70 factor (ECF subfamily)
MAVFSNKYRQLSDDELPEAYSTMNGDRVLTEIYQRFGHLMFGTCLKYLDSKEEAEDCVMELFEKLPKKLKSHSINHFKSWLYMVTKNECLMKIRKKTINTLPINNELVEGEIEGEKEMKILLEQKIEALHDAINDLKDEQKVVIQKFYLEKKSYAEVSQEMKMPINTVKSAIQNGKRNLKMKLIEHVSFKSA